MAKPESRGQLINFGLRKLGYPVLEINLDTDQIHDALDDTIQLYNERHYNGIERMYLKYKITQDDIDRGSAKDTNGVGIVTTTGISTSNVTVTNNFYETSAFVSALEKRQGLKIACLEEIAFNNGWINKRNVLSAINFYGKCNYSQYLSSLIRKN